MDKIRIRKLISSLAKRDYRRMYMNDFFLTWEKTDDEIAATFLVAEILRGLREANISCRMFDSGLGISLFRDNSTRTRFSFASACNLLGLEVQDLDEGKSQIAHGETVRETANMISFMADVIGIRDDMYIGKGNAYMHTVSEAVQEGYRDGVEEGRLEHAEKVMETVLSSVEYIEGIEATLVNVVAVAVRKVIGEIDENERIVRIVRNALVTVRNQQHVTIRVAPADEKAVREGLASMLASVPGGASFLDVVPDARLERGACLLESELGVVDASLETQLKALENALRSKIAS